MAHEISIDQFHLLLSKLLSSDNTERSNAEDVYDKILLPLKIQFLLQTLKNDAINIENRQLVAVLLRRLVSTNYDELLQSLQIANIALVKAELLSLIKSTADLTLKKKICDVVAEFARRGIDERGENDWPECLNFLFECVNSPDPSLKESALNLFAAVPGIFGNQQEKYMEVIKQMLLHCLNDVPSLSVKISAVHALSAFVLAHEEEKLIVKQMSDCVLPLIQVLAISLTNDEECGEDVLKCIVDIAEKCPQFLRCQFDNLIQFCMKTICETGTVESHKHLAIEIIISMAENAPSTLRKRGTPYLGELVSQLLLMMTDIEEDPSWATSDLVEDDDFESNCVIGETSLDRLACSVGGKTILPLVINHISQMLNNSDWHYRYAAMMAVSAVGEGCHDQMLPLLSQIVDGIIPYLRDPHPRVRYSACNALGQMSTDFAPDFQEQFHSKVLPELLFLMDDHQNSRVQAHSGAALVNFFEECPPKIIVNYLDVICNKIQEVLTVKIKELMEKGTKLVLEQTVVTLASLADAAQENFERFYDKFVPCLKYIIQNSTSQELKILRGKSIECVSLIGLAVGKEKFCSDATDVMEMLLKTQTGEEQLADDDPQLAYMISAWARICKILGPQFEPYLPYVMGPVLKAASIKIEVALLDKDDMNVVETDNDWQCVSLGEQQTFGIKTAGLEEKATACQMLVCYARELKQGFVNYTEDTIKIMVPLLKFYFHDDLSVRTAAAESLPCLLECAKFCGNAYVTQMWDFIYPEFIKALQTEPEKDILCEMMIALSGCIECLGKDYIKDTHLDSIVKILDGHLKDHFARSQERLEKRKDEDYDEGVEETLIDEDDEDVYVLSKVADVLHSCFLVCKDEFLPYFDMIANHFVNLTSPDRSWTEHQWAICVVDDIIEHGGHKCVKYQEFFIPLLIHGLQSQHAEIRQAASYGWGVVAKFGGDFFAKHCSDSIILLIQIIEMPDARSDANINATENAISAVTKILQYNNKLINMDELLKRWLTWLPIWEDEEELPHVYEFLLSLIEHNHPIILGENNLNIPRIVAGIGEILARNAVDINSPLGLKLIAFLKSLQQNANLFSNCMNLMNTQQNEAINQVLMRV